LRLHRRLRLHAFAAAFAVLYALPVAGSAATPSGQTWVGSWASAQQLEQPYDALPDGELADVTLRQVVHLSAGGGAVRIRISNAFGTEPLHIIAAHVARAVAPASAAIVAGTDRVVTFAGSPDGVAPAGAELWSDPIVLDAPALSDLAVSLHLDVAPARKTIHPLAVSTAFLVRGNQVSAMDLPAAQRVGHRWFLSGVDVTAGPGAGAVVAFGDSITDGYGATVDGNDRWPDVLAARLQKTQRGRAVGVLNAGISGNRLLLDGAGPNALARFDRDVLAQTGARTLIVLEGVNDVRNLTHDAPAPQAEHEALVAHLIGALGQIIERAHARGIYVVGATILPDGGSDAHDVDAKEADRQRVNAWIRAPGHFDAVVDFDAVVRDPAKPDRMRPEFDCGDHLHPSPAGYRAMAAAIPLEVLTRR
jgi:lysophospholipase L1-like esterase